ncbi:MAG: nucleoside 2-deoxyribosyltransferase [Chloroflexi bacterium]|nr:nucleoside 2-deoxyribosyltransferase [Chloroflexota bacterium]
MNLYFACSLTGGRQDEGIYGVIVRHLEGAGHEIPTAHLADPGVMELEKVTAADEIYERDIRWIEGCEALIAEVSTPSHGVGYEIACALRLSKPVLCCYRAGVPVSKMILGNDSPGLIVRRYQSEDEVRKLIDKFLASLG